MEINIKTFGPSTNLEMLLKGLGESQKFLVNDGLDYKKIIDEDRFNKNSVFLSVLIRTQGTRNIKRNAALFICSDEPGF